MPFGYGIPPGSAPDIPGAGFAASDALFSRDLLGDVISFIDAQYRTYRDRGHRAIAGLSMGGGQSLGIGLSHLDLFSYIGGFSAALRSTPFEQTFASVAADSAGANRKLHLLWFGCGTEDSLFGASERFSKFLDASGVKHVFHKSDGAHTWMVWRRYLNEFAPLLF
jgi:enterochelin esterase family protein